MTQKNIKRNKVAVCGLGIAGIAAVKNLTEAGFDVTGFEASDAIGGLWHYTEDERTSCLSILKKWMWLILQFCFSDFPYAGDASDGPLYPKEIQAFLESYAEHFDIVHRFRLNTKVTTVSRVGDKWSLLLTDAQGKREEEMFDRLVVCNGLFQTPKEPRVEGLDQFRGEILNAHTYKSPKSFDGKRVLVVGLGSTATDIARGLAGRASQVFISHRNGCLMLPYGKANDICFPPLREQRKAMKRPPFEQGQILHKVFLEMQDEAFDLRPEWGLANAPAMPRKIPIIGDEFYDLLVSGAVTLVAGVKRVLESHVELTDGNKLEVDAIIFAIGYNKSFSLLGPYDPSRHMPQEWKDARGSMGRPLARLYQGIFSLDFPDSLAYSETVGPTLSSSINADLASMALAQVWLGASKLPSASEMAKSADAQNQMVISIAKEGDIFDPSIVNNTEWTIWADRAAGLGIQDRIGYGWKSWWLWLTDYRLYKTLLDGKFVPQVYRIFDEGKRKPWKGARESFFKANGMS
ncbi:flavin monooxygenase-like protein [Trichoderma sp. SZMC 28012]